MYRVIGADGQPYIAPDLATLQSWIDQRRIAPAMQIEDMQQGRFLPASAIPGLRWPPIQPQQMAQSPFGSATSPYHPALMRPIKIPWVLAILGTLIAFPTCIFGIPVGIFALVNCSRASRHLREGDHLSAQAAAASAQAWTNGVMLLAILGLIYVFLLNRTLGGLF